LHGFNLNAKLDIDPDFLKVEEHHDHGHDHGHNRAPKHDEAGHVHDEHCGHDHDHSHGEGGQHLHHHHTDDDVKSFVFRANKALDPAKLEDFLGAIVNIYGPKMLRYKGVLNMKGTERKVIFQGVHQLMGSDLGPLWGKDEVRSSKMVFIGIDLPKDILLQGLENCYA
jgi:G3E family GTPase